MILPGSCRENDRRHGASVLGRPHARGARGFGWQHPACFPGRRYCRDISLYT